MANSDNFAYNVEITPKDAIKMSNSKCISSKVSDEKIEWQNKDNNNFYERIKTDGLKRLAEKAGLSTGYDIDLIKPYWLSAKSILEAGAGYGRVIEYLLKNNFTGKITAIERCQALFEELKSQFSHKKNLRLLKNDIRNLFTSFNEKFDLILMLWCGIADFIQAEQLSVFSELKKFLTPTGIMIIDTIPDNVIPVASIDYGERNYLITAENSQIYVHLPTTVEIHQYAKMAGFEKIEKVCYQTDNQRQRWLYIMS